MPRPTPIDRALLDQHPLPDPEGEADKDSRGRVLVVGGSLQTPGAVLLSGIAAYRSGAGKVRLAVAEPLQASLGAALPEARVVAVAADPAGEPGPAAATGLAAMLGEAEAVLVGPGLLCSRSAGALAVPLASAGPPVVIDGAAVAGLNDRALDPTRGPVVITPHAGEMAALAGLSKEDVQARPEETAARVAVERRVLVVLKGRTTFIAAPDGRLWRHQGGVRGLGVAGSGDVLAGAMAGLLAQGLSPEAAALWAVFAHGKAGEFLAGEVAPFGFLAREVADALPRALRG